MRANSTISILSAAGSEKIAVPITAASRRRWKLMEEDSITLYFNLAESIDFAAGDYIVDEVFGRFVISEEPVPADYDSVSGAYKYTLRFDADWICWKNYILMLTYNGVRKETSWVLTDTLENHLAVVIQNLTAVGFTGYSVSVDANSVPDKGKAVCVTYSGTSILDALKNLADAYECEFWLDGKVIRFGKCLTGTMTDLSMTNENGRTINVENMVPMRNDSEYGNRFFAYGSTKNLPETYRKHLSFKADTTSRIGGYTAFKDSLRPMFPDFLKRSIVQTSNPAQHSYEDDWLDYSYTEEEEHDEMTTWKNIRVEKTTNPIPVVQGWPFTITPYTSQYGSFQYTVYIYDQDGNLLISTTNTLVPMTYTIPEGVDKITVRYSFESETHLSRPAPLPPTVEWLDNTEYAYFATVSYTGGTFLVRLMDGWFRAVNSRTGTVTYKNPPSGFVVNTEYTLLATGDDAIKVASIPYSYYTDDDDTTDSVRVLGERRLMLPRPPYSDSDLVAIQSHIENGYVQRESLSRDQVVERVVFFDEIYPRCALRITQVDVGEYANDTTYSDGSVKIANLPSYTLQAQLVTRSGDVAFPFDPETMMVVGKLTATFLTPDEAKVYSGRTTENACSLMGMTFDVACNRSNGVTTYQLVWNSDYGEKLPNEILMPKVGDCFILAGWNPAAMASLGLIDAAEKELALTADRYAELLEEAQFNFDCTMMSDWVKAWYDGKTPVSGELPFRRLILPGQSVRMFHGALSAPKETRVIGFEYKLDIPYDSPVLTVGESDAYSRLREIEKSLHASSQSSTATSNTTSVNIAGGGGSVQGGQTLHLTPGTMTGMSPVDYNGSEEKTFRVPSVIDHLVDSDKVPRIATNIAGDKVLVDKEGNEVSGKQFFEEKTDPNDPTKKYIWLKDEYTGLGALGWLATGGVGNGGGGGGGIISSVYGENRLGTIYSAGGSESLTETFSAFAIDKIWQAVLDLQQSEPDLSGYGAALSFTNNIATYLLDSDGKFLRDSDGKFLATAQSASINLLNADGDVISHIDLPTSTLDLSTYATQGWVQAQGYLTSESDPTVPAWAKAQSKPSYSLDEISGTDDLRAIEALTGTVGLLKKTAANTWALDNTEYVPTSRKINGSPLSQDVTITAQDLGVASWAMGSGSGSTIPFDVLPSLFVARTLVTSSAANGTLLGIDAISHNASSGNSDTSRLVWDGTNGAWHFLGNLYVDGWLAGGGIGQGGSGGFGVEQITTNEDGTIDFHFTGGDITTVDLNHEHPQYPKYVHLSSESEMPANPDPDTMYIIDGGGGGGGSYTLPIASASTLGGIKVGTGLSIDSTTGVLSATGGSSYTLPTASASTLGGVKVGDGLSINSGTGVLSTATKIVYLTSESQMPATPDANTLYVILES